MKKFISMLLVAMMILTLTGCKEEPKDPKVLLEDATKKMQEVDAMDFSMVMDMNMVMGGETVNMVMNMDIQLEDSSKETMKMAMPMSVSIPSQGMTMDMNIYYTDGYYYMDMLGMKMKAPMPIDEFMDGMDESTSATNINLEGMKELTLEEKDDSYVISFVGDTEKMLEYVESVMESMKSMSGMENANMTLSELKGTITINDEGYITEQVVDMTMTMDVEGESVATTAKMTLTYNKLGDDVVVEFPDLSEYQETTLTE